MELSISRRRFVGRSCGLLAGAAVASRLSGVAIAQQDKPAIAVTCRDSHLKVTDAKDCWSAMATLGADGVEATVGENLALPGLFHPERKYTVATPEGMEQVAADMRAAGRKITAFCMYNQFDARPEFEIQWGTKVAQAATQLGVKAIRIDVVSHKIAPAKFLDFAVATMKRLMDATESTGVAFGIENHGGTTNAPEFLSPLFDRVGSPRLGLTLDTGNFYWYGHPLSKVHEFFEAYASRVFHTHCKSIGFPESEREKKRPMGWQYEKYTCPIDKGDIDYRRLVAILRKAGYANDLCVEDESLGHFPQSERAAVVARELQFLKGLL
jgi:sugar phosphate isomerase/epimerase